MRVAAVRALLDDACALLTAGVDEDGTCDTLRVVTFLGPQSVPGAAAGLVLFDPAPGLSGPWVPGRLP